MPNLKFLAFPRYGGGPKILKVGHVILVTPPLSPHSKVLYSSISLIVWSSFVTIALSVVNKYAETLSIGLSWRFSPKSGFGVHGARKYFGYPMKTIGNHVSWESTFVTTLANIGGRLRSVERSIFIVQWHYPTFLKKLVWSTNNRLFAFFNSF